MLQRRKALTARTGLQPGKPLERKKALAQVGRKLREKAEAQGRPVKPALSARHDTGPDRLTVEAIQERAQHSCERCTEPVGPVRGRDWQVHHRRPRGAGGSRRPDTNSSANCVLICPRCHSEVESHRATAMREGWLLQQTSDPARVPLLIQRGAAWVYLTADSRYSLHPPTDLTVAPVGAGEETQP